MNNKIQRSNYGEAARIFIEEKLLQYMPVVENDLISEKTSRDGRTKVVYLRSVSRNFTPKEIRAYKSKLRRLFETFFKDVTNIVSRDVRKHACMIALFEKKKNHVENVLIALILTNRKLHEFKSTLYLLSSLDQPAH